MTILSAALVVAGASAAQLVLVPLVASARGHSGPLWFMVTALWLGVFGLGAFASGGAAVCYALLLEDSVSAALVFYAALCAVAAWLPTFAVSLLRPDFSRRYLRRVARRRGTLAARRGAPGRGRNFSTSARR